MKNNKQRTRSYVPCIIPEIQGISWENVKKLVIAPNTVMSEAKDVVVIDIDKNGVIEDGHKQI